MFLRVLRALRGKSVCWLLLLGLSTLNSQLSTASAATVTGSLLRPDGQPFVGQITFDPLDAPLVVAPGQVVVQTKVISSTNPLGQFSATLEAGRYRLTAATISGIRFTVPDTDGSYDLLSLVTGGLNQAPDFVPVTGAGDMLQSVYDPNGDGKVTSAVTADSVPWSGITSAPSLQPLDPDLTELAANQGIIRTNGAWEGTLTGDDISAQGITAGLFTSSTPFTGAELPETLAQVGFVKELTPAIAETLEDLQAATVYQVSRWAYVQTGDPLGHWVYCPESTTASNGTNVVRPASIVSDSSPGRWEKIPAASGGGGGSEETASSILTKLLTVDGAGSGLDADTLDGQSSAAFQPVDSDLTSIAALTTTSFGRGLLDDADAAALRASAGLGTLATQNGTFSGTSSGTNTGDETAAGILTKLLTVDGSGSGLDADTLDGQSSAAFQPVDSDLTSIAALATTSFGRGLLDDADASAGRTTLGVVIGTDVQAYDADLADLADGSLTGSKVGTGLDAGNITAGLLGTARGGTGVDNSTGGTANTFWARPNGATGAATYRAIVAADIPTLNQNTTGSAATLTTSRSIYGNSFNGSADLTQIIGSAFGGTGNGFTKFSGATTSEKTYTLPNANATILTDNAVVTVAQGGTGLGTLTANNVILGNGTSSPTFVAPGTSGNVLTSNGTTWTSAAPSGGGGGWATGILFTGGSTTAVIDNSAAETSIFSGTIPGGTLGTTNAVRVVLTGQMLQDVGSGQGFTLRVKFGSTTMYADASNATIFGSNATRRTWRMEFTLFADGSTSAQRLDGLVGPFGAAAAATTGIGDLAAALGLAAVPIGGTAAEDSTSDKTLDITIQLTTANASFEWYTLKGLAFKL